MSRQISENLPSVALPGVALEDRRPERAQHRGAIDSQTHRRGLPAGPALGRAARLGLIILRAAADADRRPIAVRETTMGLASAAWLSRWSAEALRVLGVSVEVRGRPPARGLVVCNHLSYLDVLVLASLRPVTFVAKAEVARWPIFGAFARRAGTLFHQRERRARLPDLADAMEKRLAAGEVVVVFPEGTSTDGRQVRTFYPAPFAPAARHGYPVVPTRLDYRVIGGTLERDVCFWGDMLLLPHLWRLLRVREIQAVVSFADAPLVAPDRKWLARESQARVVALQPRDEPHSIGNCSDCPVLETAPAANGPRSRGQSGNPAVG